MFLSILRRKGYKIEIPEDWNGHDEELLVEGQELWEFVNSMSESKHELFKDYTFLITRLFDARVKSFVKNILMGSGKNKVPIAYFSYRVEFQARGMPHIHGVAWIKKGWLEERGIFGYLSDHVDTKQDSEKKEACCLDVRTHHRTCYCRSRHRK